MFFKKKKEEPVLLFDGKLYAVKLNNGYFADMNSIGYSWPFKSEYHSECWTENKELAEQILKRFKISGEL